MITVFNEDRAIYFVTSVSCIGHSDVQTTLNTYAHVTEDAEMRSAADWKAFTAGWRTRTSVAGQTGPFS